MLRQVYLWPAAAVVTALFSLVVVILSYLVPQANFPQRCVRRWGQVLLRLNGTRVTVRGAENVLHHRPQVFVANHQSWADILVVSGYLPCDFRWVSKKEVFEVPILGWAMRRAGYIGIDRENRDQARRSVDVAAAAVRAGASLVLFPEGTRSPDGAVHPFKRGAYFLAQRAGVPLLPVALEGTRRVLAKGTWRIGRGDVTMVIDKPQPVAGLGPDAAAPTMERIRQTIAMHIDLVRRGA